MRISIFISLKLTLLPGGHHAGPIFMLTDHKTLEVGGSGMTYIFPRFLGSKSKLEEQYFIKFTL